MTKIEDRRRRFVVDGALVATGVVAVGDAWACTNPSLGGARRSAPSTPWRSATTSPRPLDDPAAFARQWDAITIEMVGEWYEVTRHYDRHRLAESEAMLRGEDYEPHDQEWTLTGRSSSAPGAIPTCCGR